MGMKNDFLYITDDTYFESTSLHNPIAVLDHKVERFFPSFYCLDYDLRLLATRPASKEEQASPFFNDYREKYGSADIHTLDAAFSRCGAKNVFLNGFQQTQFLHVAPMILNSAEVLYFYKCPKIHDLSILSQFPKLKCVFIYWNNSLEQLWDMRCNPDLKIISFFAVSKLSRVEALEQSNVEYVCFDSSDLYGHRKDMLFDKTVFERMPYLRHLTVVYNGCNMDQ